MSRCCKTNERYIIRQNKMCLIKTNKSINGQWKRRAEQQKNVFSFMRKWRIKYLEIVRGVVGPDQRRHGLDLTNLGPFNLQIFQYRRKQDKRTHDHRDCLHTTLAKGKTSILQKSVLGRPRVIPSGSMGLTLTSTPWRASYSYCLENHCKDDSSEGQD